MTRERSAAISPIELFARHLRPYRRRLSMSLGNASADDSELDPTRRLHADPRAAEGTSQLSGPDRPPVEPVNRPESEISGTFHPHRPDDSFPRPGDQLLHFELVEELGRGAFARVFLARQDSLAHRQVVLKITATPTDEPQKLARLRHANVVPVYSVHAVGGLEVVCMPFLGRVTLARVLSDFGPLSGRRPESGRDFFTRALAEPHNADNAPLPDPIQVVGRMSPTDAALWLVSQLAAGLGHAHSRGILHRDLKPANVLVAADGVPMILDFNVSSESARPSADGRIGGTFPYMAPEHLRAFAGEDTAVDERSDLYSLGVILYELLTGRLPYPTPHAATTEDAVAAMVPQRRTLPPRPSSFRPEITPAVDAIALKLIDPEPDRRYQKADDLREDLTRQLAHQPLRFAREGSRRERLRKWRRRNPRTATGLLVAALALFLLILPAGVIAARQSELAARARETQRAEAQLAFRAATADLQTAAVQLASRGDPLMREQGYSLANAVLDRYGAAAEPGWESRPGVVLLDTDQRAALKTGLGEVLVLMTRADLSKPGADPVATSAALRWNRLASSMFADADRPAVIARQRRELEPRPAGDTGPPATVPTPEAARDADLYFDGLDLATGGRYREALPLLTRACARRPGRFQAWFARGVCHDMLGQAADALAAYGVCVALRPDFPITYHHRGVVSFKLRRFAEAEADLTRALELKPNWWSALLHRGLARDGLRRPRDAAADYTAALADPNAPTRLYFLRARSRRAAGDTAGYAADRADGLAREPADGHSYRTRATWRKDAGDFAGALADFGAALRINPADTDALLNEGIVLADHLHREAEAIPLFDRVVELAPTNADAVSSRGVYHARLGHPAEARRDAAAGLKLDASAYRLFQVAGLYAQLSKVEPGAKTEALKYLARSLRAGFNNPGLLKGDPDLDPIRNDPGFTKILAAAGQLEAAGR